MATSATSHDDEEDELLPASVARLHKPSYDAFLPFMVRNMPVRERQPAPTLMVSGRCGSRMALLPLSLLDCPSGYAHRPDGRLGCSTMGEGRCPGYCPVEKGVRGVHSPGMCRLSMFQLVG